MKIAQRLTASPSSIGGLCLFLVLGCIGSPECPGANDTASSANRTKIHKVLFLGNSITRHGPAPHIGWLGDWGMAASAAEKDYVHLVLRSLAKSRENTKSAPESMIANIAEFERNYATYDCRSHLRKEMDFQADLIIVAIGENVPALASEGAKDQFQASLTELLQLLTADRRPTLIVRSCFWPNQPKDEILKQACQKAGGVFVDISNLSADESNYARSEREFTHAGVAAHPGDAGMQALADALLKVIDHQESN